MAQFPEAIEFDRQVYDARKCGTEGSAYKIIRRVEPPVNHDLKYSRVGSDAPIPLGFEAWRQLHLEYVPRSKETGINHMMSSSSAAPARNSSDLGDKIHEAEAHMREAGPLKGGRISDENKKVELMNVSFEELSLHIRRQGFHTDRHIYEEPGARLTEQVTVKDEERAANGSARPLEEDEREVPTHDQGQWIEDPSGIHAWFEAEQLNALMDGGEGNGIGKRNWKEIGGQGKGTDKGKGGLHGSCNWCGKPGHEANECEDKIKYFKERGWGRQPPQVANTMPSAQSI